MIDRSKGIELILGMSEDSQFGPVMLFGEGGVAVEQLADRALALPPLNLMLARDMMEQTRVIRLLRGYRDRPPADLDAITLTLVKLSQLVTDLSEVVEVDINPLLVGPDGVIALDVRILATASPRGLARLAIRPYPAELESDVALENGKPCRLRPIRPEDEPALHRAFARLSPETIRMRFFSPLKQLSHSLAAQLTQMDYDREMAFVLADIGAAGPSDIHGIVRLSTDPSGMRGEFAIVVADAMTGQGLGRLLMRRMIDYAIDRGLEEIYGFVLSDNDKMLDLCRRLGFRAEPAPDAAGAVRVGLAGLRP